jgi:pimeloyl-ACP methyl ester carboxylesterase
MKTQRLAPALSAALTLAAAGTSAEERRVRLSSTESLQVTEVGAGDPVVLIPGLFGSAFSFRHVLPRLARAGCQGIVVEPLGVGASSKPHGADYSLTAQADRVARVLEALGVERAVIVPHGVGGSVAFRLAYRHPDRVAAIVSLDGGAAEEAATPAFRRAMRLAPLLKLFGRAGQVRRTLRKTLVTRSADPRWVTEAVVDGYAAAALLDLDATFTAYRGMARAREAQEIGPYLSKIHCPVHLLVGGVPHEGAPSREEIERLGERLPYFTVQYVPRCGHFIFEEDPGAVVAAVLAAVASAGPRPAVAGW